MSMVIADLSEDVESDMVDSPLKLGFNSPNEITIKNIEVLKAIICRNLVII